jgi:putative ABC transport system ATP-binding protein
VAENIVLPMDFCNTFPVKERRERAISLLEKVGIAEQADKLPADLSGGQQQRAAIARALANDPPLIVADEPTGNLDSANGEQVMQLLEEMNSAGTTIIMVTHSVSHAERAHRIVNLFDGQLVMERTERIFEPISTNFIKLSHDTSVDIPVIKEDNQG